MTHDPALLRNKHSEKSLFTNKAPKEVVSMAEDRGFSQVMLIGGMKLNTAFIDSDLIDEIWLSVHPLLIGEGKTLFSSSNLLQYLTLLSVKTLDDGLVQLRYSAK